MGVTTRSTSSSPVKKTPAPPTNPVKVEQQEAPKVLLLPSSLSSEARILSLRHPRDGSGKRFLFCPIHGLYEFTRISHPPSEYRSMLFSDPSTTPEDTPTKIAQPSAISNGYFAKDAQILVATAFDLCFLLLALLPSTMAGTTKPLFQPLDDLFENIQSEDKHVRYIITHGRSLVEDAMRRVCDIVDAGDETMYRISEQKTMALLQQKAVSVTNKGLPATMEERFVTRALEKPVLSVKREETSLTVAKEDGADTDEDTKAESFDTQSTVPSSTSSVVFSEVSTATSTTTIEPADAVPPAVMHLQRQRVALDFIVGSYLPRKVADCMLQKFSGSESPINFAPLDLHMTELAKLKAEALAARSFGDFSRKRGLDEEEAAEERAEKKRKQDEDERKRKANQSRGVKELAKVNVNGMKKMSAFFTKKPAAAKTKP